MIKLSNIIPLSYFEKAGDDASGIYMSLAHQVMVDAKYCDYHKKKSNLGDFVILDNSAFELGESVDDQLLIEAASKVKPKEIVLPDVLLDSQKTIDRTKDFIKKYRQHPALRGVSFLAVPHGRNLNEYIDCYFELSKLNEVNTIGIGTIYNKKSIDPSFRTQDYYGRRLIFSRLTSLKKLSQKPHHLLGLGDSGHFELKELSKIPAIRSCDSSAAYLNAKHHIAINIDEPYAKISEPINFSDKYDPEVCRLLEDNIKVLSSEAGMM